MSYTKSLIRSKINYVRGKNMRTAPLYSIDLQKNKSDESNTKFKNISINESLSNQYINELIESTNNGISSIEHILNHFLVKSTET